MLHLLCYSFFFFFNDTATTEIYTLSLHDALPIFADDNSPLFLHYDSRELGGETPLDRKSTRLNSSHGYISYAVFCLKKKKKIKHNFAFAFFVLGTVLLSELGTA